MAKAQNKPESTEPSSVVADATAQPGEGNDDRALRPKMLADYVGQPTLKAQLSVFLSAARSRGEALDHVLLFGPPGLGKTTLSLIIANELGVNLRQTSGPTLEKPCDLASILMQLSTNDVLFIDEIHRLSPVVEEILYSAMEDYRLDIMIGEGDQARAITVPLAPFTLVGATTRAGSLTAPLRDRFGISGRLEYYNAADLSAIVQRSSSLLGADIESSAAKEIAVRSRGTPRIANRLLRRVRDFATVRAGAPHCTITLADAQEALSLLGVDHAGLDAQDCRILAAMATRSGPIGLETLAAVVGEASDTLEHSIEPYLLQQGYIERTPRGRVLTDKGRAHMAPKDI